jgi:hypothetical protein
MHLFLLWSYDKHYNTMFESPSYFPADPCRIHIFPAEALLRIPDAPHLCGPLFLASIVYPAYRCPLVVHFEILHLFDSCDVEINARDRVAK